MRKNKKLSSMFIMLIVLLLIQTSVYSAPLSITSPVLSSTVNFGENVTIEFEAPIGDKVYILVDGKKVWEMISEGENSVELTEKFPLGEHYFEVVSENDGASLYGNGSFIVMERGDIETIYTENFSYGTAATFAPSHRTIEQIGLASDGITPVNIVPMAFEGREGGDDKAFGFMIQHGFLDGEIKNKPSTLTTLTYNSGLKREKWYNGQNIIEYDIKFFTKSTLDLEGKGEDYAYLGGNYKNMVTSGGNVGSVNYSDKVNEWMHFKHVLDFDDNKDYLYVDNELAYTAPLPAGAKGLFQIKFQYYIGTTDGGEGYAIDNVSVTHQPSTLGFSTLHFISDGNYTAAEENVISEPTNKIKLITKTPVLKKESADIKVIADYYGKSIDVSSAVLNDAGELEITFKNNLPASGKINLDIALPERDENGVVESTKDYFYSFETDYEEITIKNVLVTEPANGNKEYFLNEQLTGEKSLNAAVEFNNLSEESKEAILAAVVYDGDKIVEMEIKNIIVPSGEGAEPENISFSVPAGVTAPKAELYLFDSFAGNNALTKLWSLK